MAKGRSCCASGKHAPPLAGTMQVVGSRPSVVALQASPAALRCNCIAARPARWAGRPCRRAGRQPAWAPAAAAAPAEVAAPAQPQYEKPTLFDMPVSNNGARVRFIIYKKGLDIDIRPPRDLGGLTSPQYLALNPQGKMPLLVLPDGTALPESQVIEYYLLDKYRDIGPSLLPPTPELRAKAALVARILDLYITPIQGCMYKKMDAEQRALQLAKLAFQLDVLEGIVEGPFVAGPEISFGDSALFPTMVFMTWILPSKFGWSSVFEGRPKLEAWWAAVNEDPEVQRVVLEMQDGLRNWEAAKRWDTLGITSQVADGSYNWSCS